MAEEKAAQSKPAQKPAEKEESSKLPPQKSNCLKPCCIVAAVLFGLVIIGIFAFNILGALISEKKTPIPTSTGKTTTPKTQTSQVSQAELLDYFLDIATVDSITGEAVNIRRWDQPVVGIEIQCDKNGVAAQNLDKTIAGLNKITKNTKFQRVDANGDLVISFVPRSEMIAEGNKSPDENIFGWSRANPNDSCQITTGKILIDETTLDNDIGLGSVVTHELGHALGFRGHDLDRRGCNMMTTPACAPMELFNDYDTFAISALYNSGLPLCASRGQAENFL